MSKEFGSIGFNLSSRGKGKESGQRKGHEG